MNRLAVFAGRAAGAGLRLFRPGGGSALPGLIALALDPKLIRRLAARFPVRIVVTGTNGKTTTTHLISSFLSAAGRRAASNREGANLRQGIASLLLAAEGEALVLEIDENALAGLAPELDPTLIIVTGLFRDQLDRFGEVETLRRRLEASLAPLTAPVLLNAADPLAASLAVPPRARFFAAEGMPELAVPPDTTACPRCDSPLTYRRRSYAHLGDYACPSCGFARPEAEFVLRLGPAGASFAGATLPPLPRGLHPNSAAAALAAGAFLGLSPPKAWPAPAWGRGEEGQSGGRHILLGLAKNPASLSFALAWQRAEAYVIEINDGGPDGRDVSWLWDVSFPPATLPVAACGKRGLELLTRLRYVEPRPGAAAYRSPQEALAAALAACPEGGTALFLSTYTGLREAQALLHEPPLPASPPPLARLPALPSPAPRSPLLRLLHLYPDEMGTYGDVGNITVLARRLAWRGYPVEVVRLAPGEDWPRDVDFFLLGGGEDRAQARVAAALAARREQLGGWIADGVAGLLVCGGLQLFGDRYDTAQGSVAGLGLLPLTTESRSPRLVGRLVVATELCAEKVVGFENHGGRTRLTGGQPFGRVLAGHGNSDRGGGDEGILHHHLIATYLHGPLLARNPWLADRVAGWILARRSLPPPEPLDDTVETLAAQRLITETKLSRAS